MKKRTVLIIIASVLLVIVVVGPILINICYKFSGPDWIISEWSAGDMLQYYGMILTALIAIGGVFLTFQDNRKGIKEQSRLDKLPFFSLTALNYFVKNPLFGTSLEKEIKSRGEEIFKPKENKQEYFYREEKVRAVIIEIKDGQAGIKTNISEEDKKLILNGGIAEQQMAPGVIGMVNKRMIYVPIILCNVGNGAALDFRIGFNNLKDGKMEDPKYLSSTSINTGEEFYLGFFVVHKKDENLGVYLLDVKYRDMFWNHYSQSCKFIVEKDDDGVNTSMEVEFKQMMEYEAEK